MIPFDPATRSVTGPAGVVKLSPKLAAVLSAIPVHPATITSDALGQRVWGDPGYGVCHVTVYQLRGRLADAGYPWATIDNDFSSGYSIRLQRGVA